MKVHADSVAKLFAVVVCVVMIPGAVLAQGKLAAGIAKVADFTPTKTAYVVTNDAQLFKGPVFDAQQETGVTLKRGAHVEVLGEASGGMWLLIGRAGTGIGYTERALLCAATVCKDVKG